jgi:hypothetical protein
LKKECEQLKREKERMSERQAELAMALKEVSDDYKLQKEENERLRERLNLCERQASQYKQLQSQSSQLRLFKD